jgi:hypothetical protein
MTLEELIKRIHDLFSRGFIDPSGVGLIIQRLPDGRYQIRLK